jgi:hypothetical protein
VLLAGFSPTQRTIRALKDQGRKCGIVERFVNRPGTHGIRIDLFGFGDIIALCPEHGIIAIQSCGQAFAEHYRKITEDEYVSENAVDWLKCGGKIELWGWRKLKLTRSGKAMRWQPRIRNITLADFETEQCSYSAKD